MADGSMIMLVCTIVIRMICVEIKPIYRWLINALRIRNAQCPSCEEYVIDPAWKKKLTGRGRHTMECPLCKAEITIAHFPASLLSLMIFGGILVVMYVGWPLWVKTVVWLSLLSMHFYVFLRFCPLEVAPKRWEY